MDKKQHWENVFSQKQQSEVSWYQPVPKSSIDFFESNNVARQANIIDVGSGDSYFIDYLVEKGYENIYAVDISENALLRLKNRLGSKADKVNWIVSDILDLKSEVSFDYWHDRAAFHFLSDTTEVNKYLSITKDSISTNGKMMIATFSDSGPLKCSGLDIKQYSKQELEQKFAVNFKKIKCVDETHTTPGNTNQNFTFCSFQKK